LPALVRPHNLSRTTLEIRGAAIPRFGASYSFSFPNKARSLADLGQRRRVPRAGSRSSASGVELIESDARKCVFLREAARIANAPVTIVDSRIETVKPHTAEIVTARACAPLDKLLPLAERFIGPNTLCLFLKGEHVEEELTAARQGWRMIAARHPSRADPRGVILKLEQITREPQGGG
jgi:16S rRNA (guanine527-N7)-methyltransferase